MQKIAPSFPTGSNGRPSDENATACRMGVDDGDNVGSRPQDFGMDEYFAMARHASADSLVLAIDGDDVVGRHLLEADARRLHQKAPVAVRQTHCHVPCDIIALILADEHTARLDKFFTQSIGHVANALSSSPVVAARRHPYIASDKGTSVRRS